MNYILYIWRNDTDGGYKVCRSENFPCGENRSVKYVTEIFDPVIDNKPTKVCCCNKCLVLRICKF